MPKNVDGVLLEPNCARPIGSMLGPLSGEGAPWPQPNIDGWKYRGDSVDFDARGNCTVYVMYAQNSNSFNVFTRDFSDHPMGGGDYPGEGHGGERSKSMEVSTAGWKMVISDNSPSRINNSPPLKTSLSFDFTPPVPMSGTPGAFWNFADDGTECKYAEEAWVSDATESLSSLEGLRYWWCPFECILAKSFGRVPCSELKGEERKKCEEPVKPVHPPPPGKPPG